MKSKTSSQLTKSSKEWQSIEKKLWKLNLNQLKKIHQFFKIKFCQIEEKKLTKEDYILVLEHDADLKKLKMVVDELVK